MFCAAALAAGMSPIATAEDEERFSSLGNSGIDTSKWSTTNSTYGLGQQKLSSVPPIMKRPKGTDIGISRPWPAPNTLLLSPRVPPSWELGSTGLAMPSDRSFRGTTSLRPMTTSGSVTARPQSRQSIVDHVTKHDRLETRYMLPSSQRDAAGAYSMMLARSIAGRQVVPPRPGASNIGYQRTWWNMTRDASTGPRMNGA